MHCILPLSAPSWRSRDPSGFTHPGTHASPSGANDGSVAEMAAGGEDHRHAGGVAGVDDLEVAL